MLLEGKRGLVVGIANKRSLAWGIAKSVAREGARLAVTHQGERLEKNVRKLAEELDDPLVLPCDVTSDEDLDAVPAPSPVGKWLGWGVPIAILAAIGWIGMSKGAAAAGDNLQFWILANGIPSALGAVLQQQGHPEEDPKSDGQDLEDRIGVGQHLARRVHRRDAEHCAESQDDSAVHIGSGVSSSHRRDSSPPTKAPARADPTLTLLAVARALLERGIPIDAV